MFKIKGYVNSRDYSILNRAFLLEKELAHRTAHLSGVNRASVVVIHISASRRQVFLFLDKL